MVCHQSGSCKSGESYRGGFLPLKWRLMGCSPGQPVFGGYMKQQRLGLYIENGFENRRKADVQKPPYFNIL